MPNKTKNNAGTAEIARKRYDSLYAVVDNKLTSACRESSRVCWTTIGTSDWNTDEKSVSRGTGDGSLRRGGRRTLERQVKGYYSIFKRGMKGVYQHL
jgi:hypothetical protein